MPSARFLLPILLLIGLATRCPAFSDTGHHVIAVLAFMELEPAERAEVMRILRAHPTFDQHFNPPESIRGDQNAIERWQIGVAGEWPDIIRGTREWDRPTWHYQLGASFIIGNPMPPDAPGPLPAGATLETRELYASQAIKLCQRIWSDRSQSDADRAVALCWLCHLVADIHQPLHCGSLYSETVFPDGDRGGNSIRVTNGRNLHAVWDGMLGRNATPGDVMRRAVEIRDNVPAVLDRIEHRTSRPGLDRQLEPAEADRTESTVEWWLGRMRSMATLSPDVAPDRWIVEGKALATFAVYGYLQGSDEPNPGIIPAIEAAEAAGKSEPEPVTLPESYLRAGGLLCQVRALAAGQRLRRLIGIELRPEG